MVATTAVLEGGLEASVQIENRSQLMFLLTEAAEMEHSIMCCYLFALFSLKTDTSEGLTDAQLASIRRWRRLIRQISIEEMLHLGSVCNLLTAVGGSPELRRLNLPASPRAYGASFKLQLNCFSMETLEEFIAIERPVFEADDAKARVRSLPSKSRRLSDIFSSERSYDTQGRLYRGIEDGIRYLAQKYGERGLFIGPPDSQTTVQHFPTLTHLVPVTDLASAMASLKVIVEQGEGAPRDTADSHYSKFVSIREDFKNLLAEDPAFEPARPVISNPYAQFPSDMSPTAEINIVEEEATADISNFFDGCYEMLVQMLTRLFVHGDESPDQLVRLAKITEGLMIEVLQPVGSALTQLPAGPSFPGLNAGPGFRLSRGAAISPHSEAAWAVFRERMQELGAYCRFLEAVAEAPPVLTRVRAAIAKYAELLKVDD
jgi:hypothetical protein